MAVKPGLPAPIPKEQQEFLDALVANIDTNCPTIAAILRELPAFKVASEQTRLQLAARKLTPK